MSINEAQLETDLSLSQVKEIYNGIDGVVATRFIPWLWREFSNDQAAICLLPNSEEIDRFKVWLKTGNPDDAWS